jgi:hypothetical protein
MLTIRHSKSGSSLIGIVIALAILCLLMIFGTRMYRGERQRLDNQSAKVLEGSGIQTNEKRGIIQTAREQVAGQEKLIQSQRKKMDEAQ